MKLPKLVTFTGADDSVKAKDILKIAKDYPDTEWGILFGAGDGGGNRFPSRAWIEREVPKLEGLNLCAHFCGRWVVDLVLRGDMTWMYSHAKVSDYFKRVQLNFHGMKFPPAAKSFLARLDEAPYQFIFQNDKVNGHLMGEIGGSKRVRLFDVSHGAGVTPDQCDTEWPKRSFTEYMGYAGGLGPNNIVDQLKLIEKAAAPELYGDYWIDMETKVRNKGGLLFDLNKVRDVCEKVWG